MRKLLIIGGSLLLLVAGALAAALMLVDVNQFRVTIQSQLERSLGRKVALGNLGLQWIPLSIRVDDFAIAEDPSFESGRPFVAARQLNIRAGIMALLQKRIEVHSALLQSPVVELIRNKDGKWNAATLAATQSTQAKGGGPSFELGELRLENGTVAVTDEQNGKPRVLYERIALLVSNYTPGQRFTAEGSAKLPGNRKEELAFKIEGMTGATDLDGTFALTDVSAGPAAVSGDGTMRIRGNDVHVKSSLRAADERLGRPVQINSTVQFNRASGEAVIEPLEIQSNRLAIRGKASAATNTTPATFRADLRTDGAPVEDLLATAAAFRIAQGASGTGTVSANLHVEGRGDALTFSGSLAVPQASIVPSPGSKPINVQSANVRLASSEPMAGHIAAGKLGFDQISLSDVTSNFQFAGGVLRLDALRARAFGGDVGGNMVVDTRGAAAKMDVRAKLSGMDANQLLTATTAVKALSGKLSSDTDLRLAPSAGQAAARGLSGTVRIALTDGRLSGIHLLDQFAQVGKFISATGTAGKSFTTISKLAGTLRIDSGLARTDDLQLDFDGGSLSATGTANLADETLDLSVAALLAKDVSQTVGGSKVGGYMTTVLANGKGELMIPAKVTGTFSKPRFLPDPARLAKMRFGSVGSAAATAGSLFKQLTKPKPGQEGSTETIQEKTKPFTDLLESLGKRK